MPIDPKKFLSELNTCFAENGFASLLTKERAEKLLLLTQHLLAENEKYNLTAVTDPYEIPFRHYLDCAPLAHLLPKGARVIDIGCGAGFPTLPLALFREDITVTAVDSTEKKINFVKDSAALLGLDNVTALSARAEALGTTPSHREHYDIAVSRAVASMKLLVELCLPLARVGGELIAMKGKNASLELREAKRGIALLGGRPKPPEMLILRSHGEEFERPLLRIEKKEKTPVRYPRPYAQIAKKPL